MRVPLRLRYKDDSCRYIQEGAITPLNLFMIQKKQILFKLDGCRYSDDNLFLI